MAPPNPTLALVALTLVLEAVGAAVKGETSATGDDAGRAEGTEVDR